MDKKHTLEEIDLTMESWFVGDEIPTLKLNPAYEYWKKNIDLKLTDGSNFFPERNQTILQMLYNITDIPAFLNDYHLLDERKNEILFYAIFGESYYTGDGIIPLGDGSVCDRCGEQLDSNVLVRSTRSYSLCDQCELETSTQSHHNGDELF